jgi:hypothetical protein
MILLEFAGEPELVSLLTDLDFVFFDNSCCIKRTGGKPLDDWDVLRDIPLSNGIPVAVAWPTTHHAKLEDYAEFIRQSTKTNGSTWTDLLCVRRDFLPEFMYAAGRLDGQRPPNFAVSLRSPLDA